MQVESTVPQSAAASEAQRRARKAERARAALRRSAERQRYALILDGPTARAGQALGGRSARERVERCHGCSETDPPVDAIGALAIAIRAGNARAVDGCARRLGRALHELEHAACEFAQSAVQSGQEPEERYVVSGDCFLHPCHNYHLACLSPLPLRPALVVCLAAAKARV